MKYIDAEKLKAEIERLEVLYDEVLKNPSFASYESSLIAKGKHRQREDLLSLIASLQEEQPVQINTLTWKDINDLERIINNVHYEFRNGIGEKSFGEEVLERFMEERGEQEQPEVDLQ